MHILIIGAGGMLGSKLVERLAKAQHIGLRSIRKISRHDVVLPPPPPVSNVAIDTYVSDLASPGAAEKLVMLQPDIIFHLAAIVSGEAEQDFEKGYRINLDGTRNLFEAIRQHGQGYRPKVIFTSSIAVFGSPFPEAISDEFLSAPLTSYGTQKAICELLLSDYSRRGFFDGIGLRMPTVCVRPGKPNKAASGFFSNIIREPLAGHEAVLPVAESVRHWFASPRAAVGFLIQAADMDTALLGTRRNLTLPGLSCTVGDQIAALLRAGGNEAVRLIRNQPDETIMRIVSGWPQNFDAVRAQSLGFKAESNFDEIIRAHIDDELGGNIK